MGKLVLTGAEVLGTGALVNGAARPPAKAEQAADFRPGLAEAQGEVVDLAASAVTVAMNDGDERTFAITPATKIRQRGYRVSAAALREGDFVDVGHEPGALAAAAIRNYGQ